MLDFMTSHRRNPSKHRIEEHLMLNWMKYNRKMMNAGKLKADREKLFKEVLALGNTLKHINQYDRGEGKRLFLPVLVLV